MNLSAYILEELRQLWFFDYAPDPISCGNIYFSAGWFNGLIKADIKTGDSEIISVFPDEQEMAALQHGQILRIDNRLYFCPRNISSLHIYDMESGEIKKIDLPPNEGYWREREIKFLPFAHEKKIYFIPHNYNQILLFDTESETFTAEEGWFQDYLKISNYSRTSLLYDVMFINHFEAGGNIVWQVRNTDYFFRLEKESGRTEVIEGPRGKIVSIEQSSPNPYLILEDGRCWQYNLESDDFVEIGVLKIDTENIFRNFIREGEELYIPSLFTDEIFLYHIAEERMERFSLETGGKTHINSLGIAQNVNFAWMKKADKSLVLFNKRNELIQFDLESHVFDFVNFKLQRQVPKWHIDFQLNSRAERSHFFPYTSTELYIEYVKGLKSGGITGVSECGRSIYEKVKK